MAKVIVKIKGFTHGSEELPVGIPVEADDVLARLADTKEMRDGVVAVVWADPESTQESSSDPEVPSYREDTPSSEPASGEPDRKAIMAKLKEKGIKFFAGAKTEDLLAKLKEAEG